jgi:hypothetical protein
MLLDPSLLRRDESMDPEQSVNQMLESVYPGGIEYPEGAHERWDHATVEGVERTARKDLGKS